MIAHAAVEAGGQWICTDMTGHPVEQQRQEHGDHSEERPCSHLPRDKQSPFPPQEAAALVRVTDLSWLLWGWQWVLLSRKQGACLSVSVIRDEEGGYPSEGKSLANPSVVTHSVGSGTKK